MCIFNFIHFYLRVTGILGSLCVFGWDAFSGLIQILMGPHLVDVQSLRRNGRHLYDQQQPLVITGGYK